MPPLVVVLAGGRGARMGGNKPLFPLGETTLIEATLARLSPQTVRIAVNAGIAGGAMAQALQSLPWDQLYDAPDLADLGPLSGVRTALQAAWDQGDDHVITVPCDMPFLPSDFVARLTEAADADLVHFVGADDYRLCGLWRVALLPALDGALEAARPQGGLRVRDFLAGLQVCKLIVADEAAFRNINRPEDLQPAERQE